MTNVKPSSYYPCTVAANLRKSSIPFASCHHSRLEVWAAFQNQAYILYTCLTTTSDEYRPCPRWSHTSWQNSWAMCGVDSQPSFHLKFKACILLLCCWKLPVLTASEWCDGIQDICFTAIHQMTIAHSRPTAEISTQVPTPNHKLISCLSGNLSGNKICGTHIPQTNTFWISYNALKYSKCCRGLWKNQVTCDQSRHNTVLQIMDTWQSCARNKEKCQSLESLTQQNIITHPLVHTRSPM